MDELHVGVNFIHCVHIVKSSEVDYTRLFVPASVCLLVCLYGSVYQSLNFTGHSHFYQSRVTVSLSRTVPAKRTKYMFVFQNV